MPRPAIVILVVGRPAPQGSKRHVGGGRMVEQSRYVRAWREAVTRAARSAMRAQVLLQPIDGPIALDVVFRLKRPKRGRWNVPAVPPDLSKLIRATEDALTDAGLWCDDARVVEIRARKVYSAAPDEVGATISVMRGVSL